MGGIIKTIAKISPIGILASALSHKKKKDDDTPTVLANPLLPMTDDVNKDAAKKQALAMQLARNGRTSTILTDTTESLGGGF